MQSDGFSLRKLALKIITYQEQGLNNDEISRKLFMSKHTVKSILVAFKNGKFINPIN